MKPFFILLLLLMTMDCFAQPSKPLGSIAESEKKGGIHNILGDAGAFTLASSNFSSYYARCEWNINPSLFYISGSVTYYIQLKEDATQIVFDLDNSLVVDSIIMRQNSIAFSQATNKTLTVTFPQSIAAGGRDSLSIYYHGTPANTGEGSFTTRTHGNNIPVLWTLSEPYGARDWWPCRNGLDDKIDSIDIYITHPSQYKASANGLLTDTVTVGSNTTSHFKHRYPIATYLVGMAVTNYVSFSKDLVLTSGTLPVITTVYPEYLSYFQTYVPSVYNALQLYDQDFGAYPFMKERYGQTEFDWGGGMEHQTNSFITNADEYLTAHELGHQWFGDKVTTASWQDTWLNEGFATYLADIFYTEHYHPENLATIVSQSIDYATLDPHGSVRVDDTTSVDRIFDFNLTYKKGAMLVRMLRWTLGDSLFFKGINQYIADTSLRYNFAHTEDLQRNLELAGGKPLSSFFNQWFYGKGYPSFNVKWNWKDGKLQLQTTETTSDASTPLFAVPLQLTFKNATQQQSVVIDVQQNVTKTILPLSFQPDTVMIDPAQYLISKFNLSEKDTTLNLIEEPSDVSEVIIYPNPANSVLYIKIPAADIAVSPFIQVVSASGAVVYKKTFTNISGNLLTLPVAQLAKGVYFVVLQNKNGSLTKKKFIRL